MKPDAMRTTRLTSCTGGVFSFLMLAIFKEFSSVDLWSLLERSPHAMDSNISSELSEFLTENEHEHSTIIGDMQIADF